MSSWQKISSKLVYQCRYGSLYEDQVITPNGRKSIYYKDAARLSISIVALDDQQNIYLIKEDKYIPGEIFTIPAGKANRKESPLQAAQRELKEETGLQAQKWTKLGFFWASPGRSDLKGWIFLAQDLIKGQQELDGAEKIKVLKVPFQKAIDWIKKDKITDAWAIIPIFKTKLFLGL